MTAFQALSGGYKLSKENAELLNKQKALTHAINNKFIQVGAVFLKPASKAPIDENWSNTVKGQTDLQAWIDDPNQQALNVGFTLQFGWMDVDIDSGDPEYNAAIIAAMDYLGVDTRFRFGRKSVGYPTHVMVQLTEDDHNNFEKVKVFEPKPIRINDRQHHTQLRSFSDKNEKDKFAKQTVMPGSVYPMKSDINEPDMSVWYSGSKIAVNVTDISKTTPRYCEFSTVVRAVAFGTITYLLREKWVEGSRQNIATKITGLLARIVIDSAAMNEHEVVSREVFCPIDTDSWAEKLIDFICSYYGDDEAPMRKRTYRDAVEKLSRNPDAKVPGWTSVLQEIGPEAVQALRTMITPGADVSNLTKLAERYIYDETDNRYVDRERHRSQGNYTHEGAELERRHKGDVIFINGKPRESFKVFESSNIRRRVDFRDMYPDVEPGAVIRINHLGNTVPDEADEDAYTVFNTWQGWPIKPIEVVDEKVMAEVVSKIDTLFAYLTSDKPEQAHWLKQWIAWIRQYPGIKQQIAPVIIGGQGVGKSFLGNIFMKAIFGARLWGTASSKIVDNDFNVGPFKNKMMTFIDEAKFTGETSTEEVKKLIRNVDVGGVEKFQEGREYRIFSRFMFASNLFNINISQKNVQDRALFYIKATSKEHRGCSEQEFLQWTESLKPWFEEFDDRLRDPIFVRHAVRYFCDLKVTKSEVESLKYSSGADVDIIQSNMGWVRRVAKLVIENGYIAYDDMAFDVPWTVASLSDRITEASRTLGFKSVNTDQVLAEFRMTGLLAEGWFGDEVGLRSNKFYFTRRWGDVIDAYSGVIGVKLSPYREIDEKDRGENVPTGRPEKRRGEKAAVIGTKF